MFTQVAWPFGPFSFFFMKLKFIFNYILGIKNTVKHLQGALWSMEIHFLHQYSSIFFCWFEPLDSKSVSLLEGTDTSAISDLSLMQRFEMMIQRN